MSKLLLWLLSFIYEKGKEKIVASFNYCLYCSNSSIWSCRFLHPADSKNPKLLQWLCKEEIRCHRLHQFLFSKKFIFLCSSNLHILWISIELWFMCLTYENKLLSLPSLPPSLSQKKKNQSKVISNGNSTNTLLFVSLSHPHCSQATFSVYICLLRLTISSKCCSVILFCHLDLLNGHWKDNRCAPASIWHKVCSWCI